MRKWSCYLYSSCSPDEHILILGDHQMIHTMFNALQLQEDVVATYLAGKAMIESANYLRTPFSFVSSESTCKELVLAQIALCFVCRLTNCVCCISYRYSNPELAHLSQQLPSEFKVCNILTSCSPLCLKTYIFLVLTAGVNEHISGWNHGTWIPFSWFWGISRHHIILNDCSLYPG